MGSPSVRGIIEIAASFHRVTADARLARVASSPARSHPRPGRLAQVAEQVFGRDAAHVGRLLEVVLGRGAVALGGAAAALEQQADADEQEDAAKGDGEGDEHDEAEGQVAAWDRDVSEAFGDKL